MQAEILNNIKKTVVFIKRHSQICGTGFLLNIRNKIYMVTAKHVVADLKEDFSIIGEKDGLSILNNLNPTLIQSNNILQIPVDSLKKDGCKWFYHDNPMVDLAMIAFPNFSISDIKYFDEKQICSVSNLSELNEVFFLSYQPGIPVSSFIKPITRKGIISYLNENRSFYIDGAAFPGNSGSPVFTAPVNITLGAGGSPKFHTGFKFVGIISSYIPYQDVAVSVQTQRPRVVFEENTGLSCVLSTDYIMEINV